LTIKFLCRFKLQLILRLNI